LGEERLAGRIEKESVLEGSAVDDEEVGKREPHLQGGRIFFEQRGVEHSGIVGGKGDWNAVSKESWKRMLREIGGGGVELDVESIGAEVAGGADFQRDLAFGESAH